MINFENLDKCVFPGVGKYDIPEIEPVTEYPHGDFIHIGDATREKHPENKIIHCFVDDYSLASAPAAIPISAPSFAVTVSGDSDFLRAVSGKDGDAAWSIIDGLMDTLRVVNPKVYDSIMRKIKAL